MAEGKVKCRVARVEKLGDVIYKVLDRRDTCYPVQKVLAKHQGVKLMTPAQFVELKKSA